MAEEQLSLEELLQSEADPARVDQLMKLVKVDLVGISDDVKRYLVKQQVEMFNLEQARFRTKITNEMIDQLMENSIDTHVHGGSDPFERRLLEDEIAIEATKAKMKAVVIKTWYTPSASRNALVQKIIDKWAEEHQMRPVMVFGGVTLNYSMGGLNPEAVKRCLGFPRFKYVWMPMVDSYYHQLVVLNRKDRGIKYLTDKGKIVPELKEILRIIADNDLILASGHYPYSETASLIEEAKKLGVQRIELVHPTLMYSKYTLAEMKVLANEGVKINLTGIASVYVRFIEGFRWLLKFVKELGDHLVFGSDSGQIYNPTPIEGMRWLMRVLLAYGMTNEEVTKIFKTNPAELLGIN